MLGGHLNSGHQLAIQTLLLPTKPSPPLSDNKFKQTDPTCRSGLTWNANRSDRKRRLGALS